MPVIPETNIGLFNILYEKYGSVIQSQNEETDLAETSKVSQVNQQNSNNIISKDDDDSSNEINSNNKLQRK